MLDLSFISACLQCVVVREGHLSSSFAVNCSIFVVNDFFTT